MSKILAIILTVLAVSVSLVPARALAFDPFNAICNNGGSGSALCQEKSKNSTDPLTGSNGLFHGIAMFVAIAAGVAAIIVIIIGGLKYVTSGGDAAKAKSAKDAIVAALIGLVIIVLAGSIISFILGRL